MGGTNIGNCPHACVARPCGPLAECVPQMESYECRCSSLNSQCNKAAEVSMEELQQNKAKQIKNKTKTSNDNHKDVKLNPSLMHNMKKLNKKLQTYKHLAKEQDRKEFKIATSSTSKPTTLSGAKHQTTITPSTTRLTAINNEQVMQWAKSHQSKEQKQQNEQLEDDIIFRDVHAMHKKYNKYKEQRKQQQQRTSSTTTSTTFTTSTLPPVAEHIMNMKNKEKSFNTPNGEGQSYYYGSKPDPYMKQTTIERKLSRLPTHYESFQTDPESDILTFDDNIDLTASFDIQLPKNVEVAQAEPDDSSSEELENTQSSIEISYEYNDSDQPQEHINEEKYENHMEDQVPKAIAVNDENTAKLIDYMKKEEKSLDEIDSEPFVLDETIFDDDSDGNEEYHRKQLSQDMLRIMANTHARTTRRSKSEKSTVDSSIKNQRPLNSPHIKPSDMNDSDYYTEEDDDALLEAVKGYDSEVPASDFSIETQQSATSKRIPLPPPTIAAQTHTDWSLLKKFDIDHLSQFEVRKNFGACFAGEDSYFHYNDAETMSQIISYSTNLNLRIKTHSQNAVILWTGRQSSSEQQHNDDFLSLGIENG